MAPFVENGIKPADALPIVDELPFTLGDLKVGTIRRKVAVHGCARILVPLPPCPTYHLHSCVAHFFCFEMV